ncbi:MAG: DNA primase [Candidatus Aminicenantes bacterium]|nr:DNA primase [Candidatus Aminicenantes bacterium]
MDVKDQIKRSVPILDVAGLYVDLKPAGKYLKGLCPFHTEKTPSFFITPEKDSFSCYGCNKFGDIFTLVQELENISFPEAMNFLIDKFNVPIEKAKNNRVAKKDLYTKINEIALKYYKDNLLDSQEGKKAQQYLKERGITHDTCELFSLGYAENRWDGLYNYLRKKSCDINKAVELGLLVKGKNNRLYDRFRGRIIFPIRSESGSAIAFGGRTIFDEPAKYLNSPDTPVYKKSHHLYGFNFSRQFMREEKAAILVEGYFDMISLFQHGVKNVSASLGTALTENQIYLLKRFAENIYIFYDSDAAGEKAAVRGIEKMFEQDINPRIIIMQEAKDPDDFIRARGLKAFREQVETSLDGFRFLLDKIDRDFAGWERVPERKKAAVEQVKLSLDKISDPIIQTGYKELAADYFRVAEEKIEPREKRGITPGSAPQKGLKLTPAERIFLEALLLMPGYINNIKGLFSAKLMSVLASGNIIEQVLQNYRQDQDAVDYNAVVSRLSDPEKAEFRSIFDAKERAEKNRSLDKDNLWERIEASFLEFQGMLNRRDTRDLNQEIKIAERENNLEKVKKLTAIKYKFIKAMYSQKQEE